MSWLENPSQQEEKKNRRQMIETVGRADMVIMKKKIVQVNSPWKPLE